MRKYLTYSNVVATMALVFAMTGGAFAATMAAKNSVDSRAVKNNSIVSKDVKNRSLRAKDFKIGQLPTGPTGAAGSARGYALIRYADGSVDPAGSTTNVSSSRPAVGQYCVGLSNGAVSNAVVTVDRGGSSTQLSTVSIAELMRPGELGNDCTGTQVKVFTYEVDLVADSVTAVNQPFFIVFP